MAKNKKDKRPVKGQADKNKAGKGAAPGGKTARDQGAAKPGVFYGRAKNNLDLIAAALYLLVFFILEVPGADIFFDIHHQAYFLTSSLRILDGQVPFVDFYPWYGPLYHYFTALWVWALGQDLHATRLYLILVSPLFSIAMMLFALRAFRVSMSGRVFAILATGLWGVDRITYCGSARSILPVFVIAVWTWSIRSKRPDLGRLLLPFTLLAAWFFTPEAGIYLAPAAALFVFLDLYGSRSGRGALYYAAGAVLAAMALAALQLGAGYIGNYLDYIRFMAGNSWSYSLPFPGLAEIVKVPSFLFYFLPLVLYFIAAPWMAWTWRKQGLSALPVWLPPVALFGLAAWNGVLTRTHHTHLLYALPAGMIVMGWLFAVDFKYRRALQAALILAVILGLGFMNSGDQLTLHYWKVDRSKLVEVAGIKERPAQAAKVAQVREFVGAHPDSTILFPLGGIEAYLAGVENQLPFDDLFFTTAPGHVTLVEEIERIKPDWIIMDTRRILWIHTGHALDGMMDHIASNYQYKTHFDTAIVYERRPSPVEISRVVNEVPGPIVLEEGGWSLAVDLPQGFTRGFLQMDEVFEFDWGFPRRFCYPEVKLFVNGSPIKRRQPHGHGREHINTGKQGGSYRVFLPPGARTARLEIVYPGLFNPPPSRVIITNLEIHQFNFIPMVPYTDTILRLGW